MCIFAGEARIVLCSSVCNAAAAQVVNHVSYAYAYAHCTVPALVPLSNKWKCTAVATALLVAYCRWCVAIVRPPVDTLDLFHFVAIVNVHPATVTALFESHCRWWQIENCRKYRCRTAILRNPLDAIHSRAHWVQGLERQIIYHLFDRILFLGNLRSWLTSLKSNRAPWSYCRFFSCFIQLCCTSGNSLPQCWRFIINSFVCGRTVATAMTEFIERNIQSQSEWEQKQTEIDVTTREFSSYLYFHLSKRGCKRTKKNTWQLITIIIMKWNQNFMLQPFEYKLFMWRKESNESSCQRFLFEFQNGFFCVEFMCDFPFVNTRWTTIKWIFIPARKRQKHIQKKEIINK